MNHSFNIDIAKKYGVDEAIIIENLYFWIAHNKANETHLHDNDYWTYNSVRAFTKLFPYWSNRQIERIINSLEAQELIKIGNYNVSPYDRTKWFALTNKVYSIYANGEIETSKDVNENTHKVEPIPDITTNITTDISESENIIPKGIVDKSKKQYADRVNMTEIEYNKLINQYSKNIIDNKITDLDLWKGSKGKSTKSDYLTLLVWLKKDIPIENKKHDSFDFGGL